MPFIKDGQLANGRDTVGWEIEFDCFTSGLHISRQKSIIERKILAYVTVYGEDKKSRWSETTYVLRPEV